MGCPFTLLCSQSANDGRAELVNSALLVVLLLPSHGLFLSWLWTQVGVNQFVLVINSLGCKIDVVLYVVSIESLCTCSLLN